VPERADGQIVSTGRSQPLILVVDDEPDVRDSMLALLGKWRCEVIAANPVRNAWKLVRSSACPISSCLITVAGDENGIDVVARLREEFNAQVPALLITGIQGWSS